MMPTDIADALNRLEWETLRSFCARSMHIPHVNGEAVQHLLNANLLRLDDDRPAITAIGRKVVMCGSPRLWNS